MKGPGWCDNPGYFQNKGYIVWIDASGWHSHLPPVFASDQVDMLLHGTTQAKQVWVLPGTTRTQALEVAKQAYKSMMLTVGIGKTTG